MGCGCSENSVAAAEVVMRDDLSHPRQSPDPVDDAITYFDTELNMSIDGTNRDINAIRRYVIMAREYIEASHATVPISELNTNNSRIATQKNRDKALAMMLMAEELSSRITNRPLAARIKKARQYVELDEWFDFDKLILLIDNETFVVDGAPEQFYVDISNDERMKVDIDKINDISDSSNDGGGSE